MAKFGLVTEGITDQIVIENILCGFYKDYDDLDEEIFPLEPPRDETDNKQAHSEFGTGWSAIFNYLSETRFRDDVLNSKYVIIQIDTDIAGEFDCSITQPFEDIINCVIQKFINKINSSVFTKISTFKWRININPSLLDYQYLLFYTRYAHRIIFAISVHSLECWILPIYKTKKVEQIIECEKKLKYAVATSTSKRIKKLKTNKKYDDYNKLSQDFLNYKKLMKIVSQNSSFQIFIEALPSAIE